MSEAITLLQTTLTNNWNNANTNSKTPQFVLRDDSDSVNHLDYGIYDTYVEIYSRNETINPHAVGTINVQEEENVTLSVKSEVSRAHAILVKKELKRVLKNQRSLNDSDGHFVVLSFSTDNSNKYRGLWQFDVEAKVKRWNI